MNRFVVGRASLFLFVKRGANKLMEKVRKKGERGGFGIIGMEYEGNKSRLFRQRL